MQIETLLKECLNKSRKLLENKEYEDALKIINQILKVDQENYEALKIKSIIFYLKNNFEESIKIINKLISIDVNDFDNYNNLGQIYSKLKNFEKAYENIIKCFSLSKTENSVINLALFYKNVGKLNMALQTMEWFVSNEKYTNETIKLLGVLYGQNKNYEKAIYYLNLGLLQEPENAQIHTDLAYCYHMKKKWHEAWKHYEYRLKKETIITNKIKNYFAENKRIIKPCKFPNKKLIVYCEQGIGDYINFIRFIPNKENIILESPKPLKSLFEEIGYKTFSLGENIEYDYHCSIMSFPYLFNIKDISKEKYIHIKDKFDLSSYSGLKVGIVWAGNPAHPNDRFRSVKLKYFDRLTNIPNVNIFSLQKDTRPRFYNNSPEEIIDLTHDSKGTYVNLSDKMFDFLDTAKIINSLDLVISVDTSVMHLSSAMGIETWGIISEYPDWRWGDEGKDNVWYESLTLFRKEKSWEDLFYKIEKALKIKAFS